MKKLLLVCFACFFYLFSFAQKENSKDSVSFNIPVYLVDGVEVLSLDSISKDDIESVTTQHPLQHELVNRTR